METLKDIISYEVLGLVEVWRLLAAAVAVFLGFLMKRLAHAFLSKIKRFTTKTRFTWDDVLVDSIERPLGFALAVAGLGVAALVLPFPTDPVDIHRFIMALFKALTMVALAWFLMRLVDGVAGHFAKLASSTPTKLDDQIVPILRKSAKIFVVIVGAMVVFQNLGYSITSLVAGLSIGGAALALASKDTVANLFGSLVIFVDRPFQVGDWVEIGDTEGTVEEVGLRTTRIRTFANSLITMPNHMLTTTAIENWSAMKKRRIKLSIGVTYDSTSADIRTLVTRMREIIATDEALHQDFYLVNFNAFGPSSLDIFVYCFTRTTVWSEFLDVQQALLLKFMDVVQELGLSFAFPSQSLYVESLPERQDVIAQ